MRERTETCVVEDFEQTVYGCDVCDFEDPSPEEVETHYGKTHAAKGARRVGGVEFLRFESDADLGAYVKAHDQCLGWPGRGGEGPFPGWYGSHGEVEPCARGCCRETRWRFQPVAFFVALWAKEKGEAEARAALLACALADVGALPEAP